VYVRARLSCRHVLRRYLVRIFTGSSVIINDIFHDISPQANQGVASQVGHHRFLPSPFLFIILQLSYYRRYSYLQRRKTNHQRVCPCVSLRVCRSLSLALLQPFKFLQYSVTAFSFLKFCVLLHGFLVIVLLFYLWR